MSKFLLKYKCFLCILSNSIPVVIYSWLVVKLNYFFYLIPLSKYEISTVIVTSRFPVPFC